MGLAPALATSSQLGTRSFTGVTGGSSEIVAQKVSISPCAVPLGRNNTAPRDTRPCRMGLVGWPLTGSAFFQNINKKTHLALIFLSVGGSRPHTKPRESARGATVYFCLGHIGRPVSTSARDIAKELLKWTVQVWEGPSCLGGTAGTPKRANRGNLLGRSAHVDPDGPGR